MAISVALKASGIFALLIIGGGFVAFGSYVDNEGIKEAGYYMLGIGVFIVIVLAILSYFLKKNLFK